MSLDRVIMAFAGTVILASLALYAFAGLGWAIWITAFVGANMLQASFTGFCPLAIVLKKIGIRPGCAFS
ncbi:YgaP family membrane protein [Novispirillum itersonii]|uniref:Inner membrane protein YgaP-like transmembrane domain-containing protein n=1 Tax=Novispirillum itersonii TaxID=189 RepID=A0A7X0DNQ7_NOVIT|nr:DUF2892 domain-containing protein [Novispirillum itersonii]MBB6211624.1 hypothetical protein [Novispirillum itersonii]